MLGRRPARCLATVTLALIAMLATGGCQLYPSPNVEIDPTARLVERSQEAVRFDILLKLENPNDETLELREFKYSISVNGKRVYEGRRDPGANLAAGATKELELPAVVRYDALGWTEVPPSTEWQLNGHLVYLEPERLAEVLLDTGIYRPKVRFNALGEVDLRSQIQ
jgi:hypothetical protein